MEGSKRNPEFRCTDPRGITVTCSKENWQHIAEHKEMVGQQGVVRAILESPDFINQDVSHNNRNNYYKLLVLPEIGNTYIRVTVRRHRLPRGRGYVITAFACNGEKQGEVRLWSKNQKL